MWFDWKEVDFQSRQVFIALSWIKISTAAMLRKYDVRVLPKKLGRHYFKIRAKQASTQ